MGYRWTTANPNGESYLPISLIIIIVELIAGLFLSTYLKDPKFIIPFAVLAVALALIPALLHWRTYRR